MNFIHREFLSASQRRKVLQFWNNEYPEKIAYRSMADFDDYLNALSMQAHILLVDMNGDIHGWYVDFYRENAVWFGIILSTSIHGCGFGTKMLDLGKSMRDSLNGWVIERDQDVKKKNGEDYRSPLGFYLKNGFTIWTHDRLELNDLSLVKIHWGR